MRTPDRVLSIGAWTLENSHRALRLVSGGRYPRSILGMKPIELFTIGRKSGIERSTMLSAPVYGEDQVVIVASKGGSTDNPDWYKNLVANPDVRISVDGKDRQMVARTATPQEKSDLWPRITAAYKGYAGYQRNTDRDIPVVICEDRA